MLAVIGLPLLLALLFGPRLWANHVLKRHHRPPDRFPGSGAQFARHLLDRFELQDVPVEQTTGGDHYDPAERVVRLGEKNFAGRSLTAITVAAHEVGHAVQHRQGYRPLELRSKLVAVARRIETAGAAAVALTPLIALLGRSPALGLLLLLAGLVAVGAGALVHLVTLPVEWDASFGKALPVLRAGRYITPADERAARRILTACALTYAAASLAGLLNLGRWLAMFRR